MASSPRAAVKSSANTPFQVVKASTVRPRHGISSRGGFHEEGGSDASSSGQTSFLVNHVFEQRENHDVMGGDSL